MRVSEDQGRALVCAVAKGWTVEEMTLSVSVLTLNSTATGIYNITIIPLGIYNVLFVLNSRGRFQRIS